MDKQSAGISENSIWAVLKSFVYRSEATVSEIMEQTGVSPSTVSRVINFLKRRGIIHCTRKEASEVGRPREMYALNPRYGFIVLFDTHYDHLMGYLADISGNCICSKRISVEADMSMDELMRSIQNVLSSLLTISGVAKERVFAACLSVPGVVDPKSGRVQRIPNVMRFRDIKGDAALSECLGLPVIIRNVAKLAAVAEHQSAGNHNMVFFNTTNYFGIGGALIQNGKLVDGRRNAAGEIGDMFFDQRNFDTTYHEDMGCLESSAGLHMLMRMVGEKLPLSPKLQAILAREGKIAPDVDAIEAAVREGDDICSQALDTILRIWATAIINIFALLDPELLVVGGEITERNTVVLERLKYYVDRGLYYQPNIVLSKLGNQAQVVGGMQELKQYVFSHIVAAKTIKKELATAKKKEG